MNLRSSQSLVRFSRSFEVSGLEVIVADPVELAIAISTGVGIASEFKQSKRVHS